MKLQTFVQLPVASGYRDATGQPVKFSAFVSLDDIVAIVDGPDLDSCRVILTSGEIHIQIACVAEVAMMAIVERVRELRQ